ncbi:trimeric intracellular cation channel family protein [Croceicoccus mobilis]|nr:trimeric intracellular cation channel family protein [Croceicoccus mobilis]
MITPVMILELAGVAVFALSGALVAARLGQTLVTVCFFALVTGVGGGSLRDILLGTQAEWLSDPWVSAVILASALLVWFTPERWWRGQLLEWADAAGLSAFAALGTAKALEFGVAPIPAVVLGVASGCVGGIIRDVLAGQPSILMRPELYVTAAALTSILALAALATDLPRLPALLIASAAGFALRGAALVWSIELPSYGNKKAGRDGPPS